MVMGLDKHGISKVENVKYLGVVLNYKLSEKLYLVNPRKEIIIQSLWDSFEA